MTYCGLGYIMELLHLLVVRIIVLWLYCHKQPPEVFYKKAVLKYFAIITRKHLY